MPVTFDDLILAVDSVRQAAGNEPALLTAKTHGAAEIRVLAALLEAAVLATPFGDQGDDRVACMLREFRRMRTLEPCHVARELDDGNLHAQTDPQVGNAVLAGIAHRGDLALHAALAETAGNQNSVRSLEHTGTL